MNNEADQSTPEENMKNENEFLKMKLMLERGAVFGKPDENQLPPSLENLFLNNIIEFEKQFEAHEKIKVFDKLERPTHFKPVNDIPAEGIEEAWEALSEYMDKYNIILDVCSPNISEKELYRFTIEELFEYEMQDIDVPGMMHGFIYDEFHPDHVYENTKTATDDCIGYILQKDPLDFMPMFKNKDLRINQHDSLSEEEFKIVVNLFKQAYDKLEIKEIITGRCVIENNNCCVNGTYKLAATSGKETCLLTGNWKVFFERDDDFDFWSISNVQLEGINF